MGLNPPSTVEERLARIEQGFHDLKKYLVNDMKSDIKEHEKIFEEKVRAIEGKFEEKVVRMENRCQSQFRWTIIIYLLTFSCIVALILGLCVV